jgi:hypothetical protein
LPDWDCARVARMGWERLRQILHARQAFLPAIPADPRGDLPCPGRNMGR